jgi:1-pyrroline-5-carboxylate dehydrogenase
MLTRAAARFARGGGGGGGGRLFSGSALGSAPLPSWATVDPDGMSALAPARGANLVGGCWMGEGETAASEKIIDPLNGEVFMTVPLTSSSEIGAYVARMRDAPRTGLHNPLKNPERYNMLGDVCARAAEEMRKPEVLEFFGRLIQRVTPKSWPQASGEPVVVRKFLENYSCDNVRYLAKSFGVPGDRGGQQSNGYRFPFGGVSVVTPFNFPLEIPALQCMSALFMGNQVTNKVDSKVMIVQEQFVRMLHEMGLPKEDMDLIYCDGPVMNDLLVRGNSRMCLFTGSQAVADKLAVDLKGRIKLEDAGFDWKVLGPDGPGNELDFIAWQCDQDAYAFSGQKCSAQSMMFVHDAWETPEVDIVGRIKTLASQRSLEDLTSCPVLTWNNERFLAHVDACLQIPGAELAFGGEAYTGHSVPECYGAVQPTAVSVPIESLVGPTANPDDFATATTELFGPFQVLVRWTDGQLPLVLDALNTMQNHLTAGVVSGDIQFINEVLANTISGTTYAGLMARTTAAPQQHWFGPSGDVRAGGIHTKEAIQLCWSSHREIIHDHGPTPKDWDAKQT